ncbi:phosphoglycerate mutase family protein [Massilia sp. YIM B02769]|uniref:phosphoglycerate mutase family protein n=1 Tax=Massilia sp. YIM B02769 TaxID=3050129 RepID=UPI0025B62B2E|nr:phosphoglycerate mutase family protein [Massilia sp. YIM B02769]MDN4057112.1 phosphoglycerate mutase family protein [Massilia sp. YIM B02769]
MPLLPRLSAVFALAFTMLTPCAALADPAAIYLVRHGEKEAAGQDPALTTQGRQRAQNIAVMLHKAGIAHIFSTPTTRTRQTAQPLAERNGLKVALYDPRTPQALVAKVKGLHGPVLVVGHSNTLSELVRLFGGQPGAEIADNEYDRVYQLTPGANGGVGTVVFTSLPETGAAP